MLVAFQSTDYGVMKANTCCDCALRGALEQLLLEHGPIPRTIESVTPLELQTQLRMGESTMWGRIKEGDRQYRADFPLPYRDGRLTRFYKHEVEAYKLRLGWHRPMSYDAHFSALKSLWMPELAGVTD